LALLITFEAIPAVFLTRVPSFTGCPRRLEGLAEEKMIACSVCERSIMPARMVTNFIKFFYFKVKMIDFTNHTRIYTFLKVHFGF
jgi:hypothetical protein